MVVALVYAIVMCRYDFCSGFNFDFLSTSQETDWEEHLWCDLFSVEWDAKS